MSRVDGYSFLTGTTGAVEAVWGGGVDVLWSAGEALLIVGPQGGGKSTVLQQLVMRRLFGPRDLLGLTVAPSTGPVLYIAADRPRQVARSWRRMIEPADHEALRDRLVVWKGPLPFDVGRRPDELLPFAQEQCPGVGTIAIDSVKDVAVKLTDDEVGGNINRAFQQIVAAGIELVANHHQRKSQNGQ